ncbi:MAG: flavin monoamine oxidase family protein [Beijerinckiaceae bacterium]
MLLASSRRSVLFGSAALLAAGTARADDTDVIIIGAGAAGVGAARELKRLGKRFVMIEAQARAGGRVYTNTKLGQPFDGGAAYIHFSETNPWTQIAADLGMEAKGGLRLWAGSRAFRDGVALDGDEADRRRALSRQVSTFYDEVEPRYDQSMVRALRDAPQELKDAGRIQAQMAAGEDPEWISVSDWQRLEGGGNLTVREGYGTLVERAAAEHAPHFGAAATRIRWDGPGVVVETDAGAIRGRAVIVTVSIGVLQAEKIRFAPTLPLAKLRALEGLRMGALTKIGLRFEGERFGFMPHQFLAEIGDPARAITFETWPFERDLVVAVFGGSHARSVVKDGEAAAVDYALERFRKLAGAGAAKAFREGSLVAWSNDPWSHGSYAVALPGRLSSRDLLRQPVGERIWFAGEATAGVYSMTAGGAYFSGRDAAGAVAAKLTTGSLRR